MISLAFSWWEDPEYGIDLDYTNLGRPIKIAAVTLGLRVWKLGVKFYVDLAHHVLGRKRKTGDV
jgi:hypothetical protein